MPEQQSPENEINIKAQVLVLFKQAEVIKPGYTGQIIVHVNCGGVTRIEKTHRENVA